MEKLEIINKFYDLMLNEILNSSANETTIEELTDSLKTVRDTIIASCEK